MRLWLSQNPSGSAGQRATVRSQQSLATDETCRDKGSGRIPDSALKALLGGLTEEDNRLLMVSEAYLNEGYFYDTQHAPMDEYYYTVRSKATENPLVPASWCERVAAELSPELYRPHKGRFFVRIKLTIRQQKDILLTYRQHRALEMHLISRKTIREAAEKFPRAAAELIEMAKTIEKGSFATPEDLRKFFRSLDNHKDLNRHYIIDIGHNEWRAVLKIDFVNQIVFVKGIFTHKEYDVFNAKAKKGKIK